MKSKLFKATVLFEILVILITFLFIYNKKTENLSDVKAEQIIALNEINQLTLIAVSSGDVLAISEITDKISSLQDNIRLKTSGRPQKQNFSILFLSGTCMIFILIIFIYIYLQIIRPFDKMEKYIDNIAMGNFDLPLDFERSNYFGAFTWAFDNMRKEITKARSCEHEAIENNKTVIATLSHDIKTPISSIRAYAEGLEMNFGGTAEKREKYLSIIMKKCDEVAKLTNDLFIHSISDLNKLKVNIQKVEICELIHDTVIDISAEHDDVNFENPLFKVQVMADRKRFVQVTENLINNSRKYAKTRIDVSVKQKKDNVYIVFRDYGKGISDEDMPFVFDKFYRGRNCKDEQGSGLGLYIVRYIMQQMKGEILLHNYSEGLESTLVLPIIK
ncbi:HAMP domain-containing histidine kinase [Sedimentibacter sp. zth1]|uniref:HAMP domain-containing sensor histidine kinase n=1 Tax=Sedimentibacter sp. zth1 TaxID=2816908 RepID=UPI001A918E22|nr:HAMP domain-containing sensor histidine kinase [Sedimentibacter sp. zth1]QSX05699.1 HAMP domain-containing histidine kinase [Sedimentibacter sp. zth1]